jgi:UDP-N-acetylmuramoyl-tripeptide--D-alanyl-D-alanine ligase
MKIAHILKATGGSLISGDADADINVASISTDSRTIGRGAFFVPLKGNNYDGERFVGDALKKGAKGAFVTSRSTPLAVAGAKRAIICVKDTTRALQDIAHAHRMMFKAAVIGITGSNGKTMTKDMTAHVLSAAFRVLKNEGTKNNHIGVPQTLLRLNAAHDICVLEMGANHPGEIRTLAGIARPDIAVITNIGPSHLEFFGDLDGVHGAKSEILEYLGPCSEAIVNGDDTYLSRLKKKRFGVTKFGFDDRNDLSASLVYAGSGGIEFLLNDRQRFRLNVLGTHNVYNALAAIAIARRFGMTYGAIRKALGTFRATSMRLNIKNVNGISVINDAYNSNPSSMRCALNTMKDITAISKWIVSADMLELGRHEEHFHKALGESVAKMGFDGLITFGRLSRHACERAMECGMDSDRVWNCSTRNDVVDILRKVAKRGDAVLVKGSRAMKMEEVVEKIGL